MSTVPHCGTCLMFQRHKQGPCLVALWLAGTLNSQIQMNKLWIPLSCVLCVTVVDKKFIVSWAAAGQRASWLQRREYKTISSTTTMAATQEKNKLATGWWWEFYSLFCVAIVVFLFSSAGERQFYICEGTLIVERVVVMYFILKYIVCVNLVGWYIGHIGVTWLFWLIAIANVAFCEPQSEYRSMPYLSISFLLSF